ncbi:BREX-6 system BrxE protein [Leptospira bouyouniensis]|uniref:BREX-6 system BrxE protein n=1 Tax=Leptospira bouyouniensis TaxID=2484911 RepID=A0ABY2L0F4_9LEPT|nr:BREX-6 system BrxE protein [Leptospira bouyouniensis]TGK45913.1 BREX-6 system BrxE protein [Leptospira bouyouniensis]
MTNSEVNTGFKLSTETLDSILFIRFLVSRLGEASRFSWWDKNLDATDIEGGGSFFQKLLPSENNKVGLISAVEATTQSAKSFEWKRLADANNQKISLSIFIAPPSIESDLGDRIFHWKLFPNEIPSNVLKIINSSFDKEGLIETFKSQIKDLAIPATEGTSFGVKIKENLDLDSLSLDSYKKLLYAIELKQGEWKMPYYE